MKNESLQQHFDTMKILEVSKRFQSNEQLKNTPIDISIRNGVVVLSGTIKRAEYNALAVRIAKEVPGVFHVKNNLTVGEEEMNTTHTSTGSIEPWDETPGTGKARQSLNFSPH